MSAPALHIGEFGDPSVAAAARPFRAPRHPPDVLHKVYALARPLPPLTAILSVWIESRFPRGVSLRALATESFTLSHVVLALILLFVWNLLRARHSEGRSTPRLLFLGTQLVSVCAGTASCTLLLWLIEMASGPPRMSSGSLVDFALLCGLGGMTCVLLTGAGYSAAYWFSPPQIYLILGSRRRAIRIYKWLQTQSDRRSNVLGFIDPDNSHAKYLPCDYLGSLDRLEPILIRNPVDVVYIALPLKSQYQTVQEAICTCERIGVNYSLHAQIFESRNPWPGPLQIRSSPRGHFHHSVHEDYRLLFKRGIDIVLAALLVCLLAPLMLVIAIAIKVTSAGPVFFVQERYGRNRRRFRMYKFRSMVADAEALMKNVETLNEAAGPIFKIKKDPRISSVGSILRKSSLDELPQLFNVLKGEMSLVGPRPMSLRDVHLFSEASLMRRFSVVPGITGLWQVSGRSNTDFDTWIRLDLDYIDNWSLALDLGILLRTIPTVFAGAGAV